MNNHIGNLEEMVLLVVMSIGEGAYGVLVRDTYMAETGNTISLSAVHTVLRRLEKKGFITSEMGGATLARGGRRKRLYEVTRFGYSTLEKLQTQRQRLWQMIPKMGLD